MKQVYSNIKAIRLEKGLTQEDMASHLKMTQSNYGRLEKGLSQFTIERLEEIAAIFEMSINALLAYDGKTDFKENAEYYYNELQKSNKQLDKWKKESEYWKGEWENSGDSERQEIEKQKKKVKELTERVKALETKVKELEQSLERERKDSDGLKEKNGKLIDIISDMNSQLKIKTH